MKKLLYIATIIILTNCQTAPKKQEMYENTAEYKAFMQQEHRFELNGCQLKYNDKPFKLGMSLQEFEKVFGNDYEKKETLLKCDKGITVIAWYKKNIITELRFIYNNKNILILVYDSFLNSKLSFEDFLKKSSKLSFEDFLISDQGYKLSLKECYFNIDFDSPVTYHRKETGHLYIRGDWKLNGTNPIDAISIYKSKN